MALKNLFYIFLCVFVSCSELIAQSEIVVYDTFDEFKSNIIDKRNPDKALILNFWATWCKPCVTELPYFEQVHNANLPDVEVILVSMDFKNQIDTKLKSFLDKTKYNTKVIALADGDYNAWIDRISPEWSGAIPATIMFYKDKVFFAEKEYHHSKEILEDYQNLMNRP